MSYKDTYSLSMNDPQTFWGKAATGIDWYTPYDKVLDDKNPPFYHWFVGGKMNTCYNAVDRHVEQGRGEQAAIIYDSPVTDVKATLSYNDLRDATALFAGILAQNGGWQGRPCTPLYADDSRSRHCHARLRAYRGHSFGRIWRLCRQGTGHTY